MLSKALFRKIKGELKISTIKLLFKWHNSYYALNKVKGNANLDVATGLNYRYKHSKYSVGISIPLIQRKASIVSSNGDYTNSFVFSEGASHFKVFFNYGWVF
ncbi:hypothetical protein TH0179_08550 [Helicobacter pylori]